MIVAALESPDSQLLNEVKTVENGAESISRYEAFWVDIVCSNSPAFSFHSSDPVFGHCLTGMTKF